MKYRPEIDGLRALAVIPVILFHAGFGLFSGGFIGVDVFFVISGYLITTILVADIENNRFDLLNFYDRRARRILPALFFVMLLCVPVGWVLMLPEPLENFGQSVVSTVLFSNNILLWLTSGYWDLLSEFKPLLHTWSLAVEEQFYIVFPVLLFFAWRFGVRFVVVAIGVIALTSLLLSEMIWRNIDTLKSFGWENASAGSFYLAPTRAWELLAGAIAAFHIRKQGVKSVNTLSLLGLMAILFSVMVYDRATPFPGIYGLLPVLGTVLLVLYGGKDTVVAKILSTKIFVGLGLISYSAYLWHQPLFAFARTYSVTEPSTLTYSIVILLSIGMAYVSWRYIEIPFRDKAKVGGAYFYAIISGSAFVLLIFGLMSYTMHGFAWRVFDVTASTDQDMYISYNARNFEYKRDAFSGDSRVKVLVLGNSFGRDIVNVIRETYDFDAIDLVYRDDFSNLDILDSSMGSLLFNDADLIIFANIDGGADIHSVRRLLDAASTNNHRVVFIGSKHFGYNLDWITRIDRDKRGLLRNPLLDGVLQSEENVKRLQLPSLNYISIIHALCDGNGDILITDELGRLISPDRVHLTKYGAIYIGQHVFLSSILSDLLPRKSCQF